MAELIRAMCGFSRAPEEHYELVRGVVPPAEATPRLHEALAVVNSLLPTPITLDDALESLDETRRLVRARALARTYHLCQTNLARLARHVPGSGGPSLDGAVKAHREKLRRVADSCLGTILQMYMSVASADGASDLLVNQAIQSTAESEVLMEDVAIVERALGFQPLEPAVALPSYGTSAGLTPASRPTEAIALAKPAKCVSSARETSGPTSATQSRPDAAAAPTNPVESKPRRSDAATAEGVLVAI
ncbi:tegument protein UL51 [Saimiriine alphaherpesvirus 1]|uniref:Tegument protein UL51 n=1 Tax=Saimiriine herpesvirus 1 (strain MV-5-4-PSL) TaxID=10353 RepID=E2IUB9_SHV1|nr:tegument protein UL51 [Saimiriine alphaherpesvirus 1]ADO13777.1 tegument protein UL51 [Saimiriine alphaherpesvirus 1]